MGFTTEGGGGLGSLAQAARAKQIKSARIALYVVGVLTVAGYGFMFAQSEDEVDMALRDEVRKQLGPGAEIDPVKFKEVKDAAVRTVRLIYGGMAAMGVVFIVLGAIIMVQPMAMTVTALVLYIGFTAVLAVFEATTLYQGLILKVIVIICLVKAIQAAAAYQAAEAEAGPAAAPGSPFGPFDHPGMDK